MFRVMATAALLKVLSNSTAISVALINVVWLDTS